MRRIRKGLWMMVEKLLTWSVNPFLRSRLLGLLGARIGKNVRIYEARFINLDAGFRNLRVADDVHIGPHCILDLHNTLAIGRKSTLSPGVLVLTHADPGAYHDSPLAKDFPPRSEPVHIGEGTWIGARAVILCGTSLGDRCVVGANSLVNKDIPADAVAVGIPCRPIQPGPK